MPWASTGKFICPHWYMLPGLCCGVLYHTPPTWMWNSRFQQADSFFTGRYSIQRLYITMYSGISEMFWGTSDDCLELNIDGQKESRSLYSALLLIHFWVWGSSRIAFLLKHPYKHQAAGCLPMTHTKAGYNRVCRLCHTAWCGVVIQCDSKTKCKTLCQRSAFKT